MIKRVLVAGRASYHIDGLLCLYTGCGSCRSEIIRRLSNAGIVNTEMIPMGNKSNKEAIFSRKLDLTFPELRTKGKSFGILWNPKTNKAINIYGPGVKMTDATNKLMREVATSEFTKEKE